MTQSFFLPHFLTFNDWIALIYRCLNVRGHIRGGLKLTSPVRLSENTQLAACKSAQQKWKN